MTGWDGLSEWEGKQRSRLCFLLFYVSNGYYFLRLRHPAQTRVLSLKTVKLFSG